MEPVAAVGRRSGDRRASTRRSSSGGQHRRRRGDSPTARDSAVRPRSVDDLCRRSIVALAHDATRHRHHPRTRVAADSHAGLLPAPPSVSRSLPVSAAMPGTTESIGVLVRDEEFKPIGDAEVTLACEGTWRSGASAAGGAGRPPRGPLLRCRASGSARRLHDDGRRASRHAAAGVGESADAGRRRGCRAERAATQRGRASANRRCDEADRYISADPRCPHCRGCCARARSADRPTEMRDLWHNGFSLAIIVALLAAEWLVRRRVGLA